MDSERCRRQSGRARAGPYSACIARQRRNIRCPIEREQPHRRQHGRKPWAPSARLAIGVPRLRSGPWSARGSAIGSHCRMREGLRMKPFKNISIAAALVLMSAMLFGQTPPAEIPLRLAAGHSRLLPSKGSRSTSRPPELDTDHPVFPGQTHAPYHKTVDVNCDHDRLATRGPPGAWQLLPSGRFLIFGEARPPSHSEQATAHCSHVISENLPPIYVRGQAGLLDVALDQDFAVTIGFSSYTCATSTPTTANIGGASRAQRGGRHAVRGDERSFSRRRLRSGPSARRVRALPSIRRTATCSCRSVIVQQATLFRCRHKRLIPTLAKWCTSRRKESRPQAILGSACRKSGQWAIERRKA